MYAQPQPKLESHTPRQIEASDHAWSIASTAGRQSEAAIVAAQILADPKSTHLQQATIQRLWEIATQRHASTELDVRAVRLVQSLLKQIEGGHA